ncbi:MAG: SpoIIE family protein phosphatase, partial [Planctomycetota bacterium]
TTYAPGDSLLLFTDGIFETRAPGGPETWGEENLRSGFVRHGRHAPRDQVAAILGEAADFRGVRDFEDDVSVLVARLGAPRPSFREKPEPPTRARAAQPNSPRLVQAREGTRARKRPR